MPWPVLVLVVMLAAGGGVATALFVVPRATGALRAVTAASVYAEPDEAQTPEVEPEPSEPVEVEGAAAAAEPEIGVGEPEPEPVDPDAGLEHEPARVPEGKRKVPTNPPIVLDDVEIEVIEGTRPWVIHRFVPHEALDQIAARYEVTPESLRTWNGLGTGIERLEPGARVKLEAGRVPPPRQELSYVVQPGDSWWSIALGHAIDIETLRATNPAVSVPSAGETLSLWIDPAVLHWVQTDPPSDDDLRSRIRRGSVGVGRSDAGRLINGVQIPKGKGWRLQQPASSYGTTHAVMSLVTALRIFRDNSGYERELLVGSMSLPHGGPLPGYRSHQTGHDLDIRLPLSSEHPEWFPIKPWRVDYEVLWRLVEALADTGEIEVIYLDYELQKGLHKAATKLGSDETARHRLIQWPRGRAEEAGLVQHAGGHHAHIHVRFRCGRHETECMGGGAP